MDFTHNMFPRYQQQCSSGSVEPAHRVHTNGVEPDVHVAPDLDELEQNSRCIVYSEAVAPDAISRVANHVLEISCTDLLLQFIAPASDVVDRGRPVGVQ